MNLQEQDSKFLSLTQLTPEAFVGAVGGAGGYAVLLEKRGRLKQAWYEVTPLPSAFTEDDLHSFEAGLDTILWAHGRIGEHLAQVEELGTQLREKTMAESLEAIATAIIGKAKKQLQDATETIVRDAAERFSAEVEKRQQEAVRQLEGRTQSLVTEIKSAAAETGRRFRRG